MSYERIDTHTQIPDFDMLCPDCHYRCLHIHDLKCMICNNTDIVYCKNCDQHLKVKFN